MATTVHHFWQDISISGAGVFVSWQYGRLKIYGVGWRISILTGKYLIRIHCFWDTGRNRRAGAQQQLPQMYSGPWPRPAQEWPPSHAFCCIAGAKAVAKRLPFLSDGFKNVTGMLSVSNMDDTRYLVRNLITVNDYDRKKYLSDGFKNWWRNSVS